MSPAPGWYEDPSGGDTYEFYWDGSQWSGDSRYKELEPVAARSVLSAAPYHEPVRAHAHHGYHHDADATYAIGTYRAETSHADSYHHARAHDGYDVHGYDHAHDGYDHDHDGYDHDRYGHDGYGQVPEPAHGYHHDEGGVSFEAEPAHDPYDPAHYTDPFADLGDSDPFPGSSSKGYRGPQTEDDARSGTGVVAALERIGDNPVLLLAFTAAGLALVGAVALVAAAIGSEPAGNEQAVLLVDGVEPVDPLAGPEGVDAEAESRVAEDRGRVGQAEPAFVGDVVAYGRGWEYTVHAVAYNVESGNEFDVPQLGYQFVTVDAEVVNNSGEAYDVSPFFCFQAKDNAGTVFDPGFSAGISNQFETGQLETGQRQRGIVVFEIPADATVTAFLANCDLLDDQGVAIITLG